MSREMRHCTTLALILSLSACERATTTAVPTTPAPPAQKEPPIEPVPTVTPDAAPSPKPAPTRASPTRASVSPKAAPSPERIRPMSRAYRPWKNEDVKERVRPVSEKEPTP